MIKKYVLSLMLVLPVVLDAAASAGEDNNMLTLVFPKSVFPEEVLDIIAVTKKPRAPFIVTLANGTTKTITGSMLKTKQRNDLEAFESRNRAAERHVVSARAGSLRAVNAAAKGKNVVEWVNWRYGKMKASQDVDLNALKENDLPCFESISPYVDIMTALFAPKDKRQTSRK